MTDSQGGVGRAATELVDEMQRLQQNSKVHDEQAVQESARAFTVAMEDAKKTRNAERARDAHKIAVAHAAADVLRQAQRQMHGADHGKSGAGSNAVNGGGAGSLSSLTQRDNYPKSTYLARTLQHMLSTQDDVTKIMQDVLSGQQFSPPDVLKMQSQIFRHVQEIEFTTKALEKAEGGVKVILNTQMG